MAQFRTTADLLDKILTKAGEPTNGNSPYEADALEYANLIHHYILSGGNELEVDVDEPWVWARAKYPMTIELLPKVTTGTVSMTNSSEVGAFSSGPASSVRGWYLRLDGQDTVYRIASHTAGATAFEIDGHFMGTTDATANYKIFKLDYELVPSLLVVDRFSDKIDFEETASTELTATLTHGAYSPSDYATHVKTQLDSAGGSTYTISYDADTRKFTLASDLGGGGGTFKLLCQSGTNALRSAYETLGFDVADQATSASHTSTYIFGGISRLMEPLTIHGLSSRRASLELQDQGALSIRSPLPLVEEGAPTFASIVRRDEDGHWTMRINSYPADSLRVEIPYIPVPRDLKDNAQSIPLVPRNDSQVIIYGASYFLLLDKEDTKAGDMLSLFQRKLKAMLHKNRSLLQRGSESFAEINPRADMVDERRKGLQYGYTAGND